MTDWRTAMEVLASISILVAGVVVGIYASVFGIVAISLITTAIFALMFSIASTLDDVDWWGYLVAASVSLAAFTGAMWVAGIISGVVGVF